MEVYRVSFIGHRELPSVFWVEERLENIVLDLLQRKEFVEFYMGRNGTFDLLAASAVKRAQGKRGKENSSLILVLPYDVADVPYYRNYYDELIFSVEPDTHYKAAITQRNRWMIEHTELLIAYVSRTSGGAYRAYHYAQTLKQNILNIANVQI